MLSGGNGNAAVCARNLLAITRGEVPYDRIRGLSSVPIDGPAISSVDDLQQDAEWMVKTYEPRVTVQSIEVTQDDAAGGVYRVTANIV